MSSEKEDLGPEDKANSGGGPRKRSPRRVVSTETTEPSGSERDEKASRSSDPKVSENPADSVQEGREKQRRRAPAGQSKEADGESENASPAPDSDSVDDSESGAPGRGRGRGRGRDRRRGRGSFTDDGEPEISDDDVLIPIGGILDILDNYAFVRTQGYLPGPTDVYVSLGQVKKYSLRKGDAVIGAIRQPREGENQGRQKYNALVSVDTINGQSLDEASGRPEFPALTAVYPNQRISMETSKDELSGRLADIFAPIGKGQRGVIGGPSGSGKSHMLSSIAAAVAKNAPDSHLMVVLVDEQPEAITEMQRGIKGEVVSATFDRTADDNTTIAELAVERSKRLVELGHDVVVLIDSLNRLARAYQQSVGANSRGPVSEFAWLYPVKRLFGAARKIENGGSLTIIGTAGRDSGIALDDLVYRELVASATMYLNLSHEAALARLFPAVDIGNSRTRRDELLLSPAELESVASIRQDSRDGEPLGALRKTIDQITSSASNSDFFDKIAKKN